MRRKRTSPSQAEPVGVAESPAFDLAGVVFTESERHALKPPGRLRVSEWAEQNMVLPENAPLGRYWRNDASPSLAALQDLLAEDWLREFALLKGVQRGGSQIVRNFLATQADQNPLPALIVLATEKDAKKAFRKTYLQMFRDCGPLKKLRTRRAHDANSLGIRLSNGLEWDVGWAGSASSLATDPKAIVFNDECDKYEGSEKEASPVDLARMRTTKFGDRSKVISVSTPTIPEGQIAVLFRESEIQIFWHVPCPHCGVFQVLHQDQLKWAKFEGDVPQRVARIKAEKAAWFECVHPECRKKIVEEHKRQIVPRGYWATRDQSWRVYPDGRREGVRPPGDKVGAHLPSFDDYELPWHKIAGEIVSAGNDPQKRKTVVTQRFAEPFQQLIASVAMSKFGEMCVTNPETGFVPAAAGVVPKWASRILLTVDTQKDYFYYVVRAWGYGRRSQRIDHGIAMDFEALNALESRDWFYEGNAYPPLKVYRTGIDTGGTGDRESGDSRTFDVYEWCRLKPMLRIPLKGASNAINAGVRYSDITPTPPGGKRDPFQVRLYLFDTQFFAELLMTSWDDRVATGEEIDGELQEAAIWALNDRADPEYDRHLSNVHKAMVKFRGQMQERIVPKSQGVRVDYFDCEKEQFVLAVGMNFCTALLTPQGLAGQMAAATNAPTSITHRGIRRPDGRGWFAKR